MPDKKDNNQNISIKDIANKVSESSKKAYQSKFINPKKIAEKTAWGVSEAIRGVLWIVMTLFFIGLYSFLLTSGFMLMLDIVNSSSSLYGMNIRFDLAFTSAYLLIGFLYLKFNFLNFIFPDFMNKNKYN